MRWRTSTYSFGRIRQPVPLTSKKRFSPIRSLIVAVQCRNRDAYYPYRTPTVRVCVKTRQEEVLRTRRVTGDLLGMELVAEGGFGCAAFRPAHRRGGTIG